MHGRDELYMKHKRLIAAAAMLIILFTSLVPGALAAQMPSDWAVPEMNEANTTGLLSSSAARNFHAYLTRDEFCEIVVILIEKTLGRVLPMPQQNPFYDSDSIYVLKAWQYGVINGVTSTRFAPDDYVERQQLCVMMMRAIRLMERDLGKGLLNSPAQTLPYNDVDMIADYAMEAVRLALANDMMRGDDKNYFNPKSSMSSQECMAVVIRSFNRMERFITAGMTTSQLLDLAERRVNIGYAYGDTADGVSRNVTLPAYSTGGATVTWMSSNNAVISQTGAVNTSNSAQTVTLTATIRLSGQTRTKTFTLRTTQLSGDQLLLDNAYNALNILYINGGDSADSVTGRIGLPGKVLALPVTWSSSNTGVIANTGNVTVPGGSESNKVTLTAVIANGSMTRVKTFTLNVINPAYGRGVMLHGVSFGMDPSRVSALLGSPNRSIQAGSDEIWQIYHNNYGNFIAVAFTSGMASAVYSMANGVSSQLRNNSGSVMSVSQANALSGVNAVSYTDGSTQYAIMISDSTVLISGARSLYSDGQEQLVYELVNAFRQRNSRTVLEWTDRLGQPSRDHSEEMGQYNFLSTTSRNGRSLQQRAADSGFDRSAFTAGNVLAGDNDAIGFFHKMVGTATMRSNILASNVTVFGAGFSGGHSGTYRNYLTYMFGSLREITGVTATQLNVSGTPGTSSIITVSPNTTATVMLSISPSGYTESYTVTSSNTYVMTLTTSGTTVYVTGRYAGDAEIVVTCNSSGNVFTIPVLVDTVFASSLSLRYSSSRLTPVSVHNETSDYELVMGTRDTLAIIADAGLPGVGIIWECSNGATVGSDGVVTAGSNTGMVTVTATVELSPNNRITHSVIINIIEMTAALDKPEIESSAALPLDRTSTTARAYVSSLGSVVDYSWRSGNSNAASVGTPAVTSSWSAVLVSSENKGTTDLTASISVTASWNKDKYLGTITRSVNLSVKAAKIPPSEITITVPTGFTITNKQLSIDLASDTFIQLGAVVKPDNADNKEVVWSQNDNTLDCAAITASGYIVFIGEGTVIITATSAEAGASNIKDTLTINIVDTSVVP